MLTSKYQRYGAGVNYHIKYRGYGAGGDYDQFIDVGADSKVFKMLLPLWS